MSMTKEEFKEGIEDLIEDAKDPEGEFAELKNEFRQIHDDINEHDPALAMKFLGIALAVDELVAYVKNRSL